MTPSALSAALASAADDLAIRDVIRAAEKAMRDGAADDAHGVAEILSSHVTHASARVRRAVADACDIFPDPFFDRAFDALAGDADGYVVRAAEGAGKRHAVRRKAQSKEASQERVLAELLDQIEEKHGKPARRLAERAVRRGVEHFVSRLHHELARAAESLETALSALTAVASRSGHDEVSARTKTVAERFDYVWAIVRRAREYATRVRPSFNEESVEDVCDQARRQLVAAMRGRKIDCTLDVPRTLHIEADRHALLQALENVLKNAVEAYDSSAPAVVRIGARELRRGTQIELSIRDHGAGMTDERKANLFVPFASKKPGGTGIGMLMVRKMVEDVHRGELSVASALGEGTTVTIVLPRKQR